MVEVLVSGGEFDFFFKLMHGTGGVDRLDGATTGADEVIAVLAGEEEGEVGGALVEAEATQDAFISQTLEEAEDGGFVTLVREPWRVSKLGECHGAVTF